MIKDHREDTRIVVVIMRIFLLVSLTNLILSVVYTLILVIHIYRKTIERFIHGVSGESSGKD